MTQETNRSGTNYDMETTNNSQIIAHQLDSHQHVVLNSQIIREESQEFAESEQSKLNSMIFFEDNVKTKAQNKFGSDVYNRLYDREKWKWEAKKPP